MHVTQSWCVQQTQKPSYRVVFLKPFCFLQGISSFLPARSHSSVSVALDRASSNSGSRVVTSSWRVSIGFCLGTNTLPVETEGKSRWGKERRGWFSPHKMERQYLNISKARRNRYMQVECRFYEMIHKPCLLWKMLVNVTRYSHITAIPILSLFHSHKTAWLPSAVWLRVCLKANGALPRQSSCIVNIHT